MTYSFAHISDCHVGAWRNQILRDLNIRAFEKAMEKCIEKKVDFIVISGDLFDVNIPDLLSVKRAASKMREVKANNIPIYVIYGSHDYSATAVSIVDVLQSTGLFEKVVDAKYDDDRLVLNFYRDPKTGAKLTGISGRKTGLERIYYKEIDRESIQQEKGFKIFLFHTAIDEFKPLDYMYAESIPLSEVPPSFHYCAGGHIHKRVEQYSDAFGHIVWPGTLFGSTFKDLEDSAKGERRGFYIVEFDDQVRKLNFAEVNVCDIVYEKVSAEGKTPKQVEDELKDFASRVEAQGKVILLKVSGMLSAGKPSDIDFNTVLDAIRRKDPLVIVPNRHGLTAKGLTEIRVTGDTKTEIEMKLFRERVGSYTVNPAISSNAKQILKNTLEGRAGLNTAENLLDTLSSERKENEKVSVFKDRIWHETQTILKLGEIK